VTKTPSVYNLITGTGSPLIRFDNLFQYNDSKLRDLPDTNRGPGLFQRFNARTETKLILILTF
jgi:hypothetical protein